MAGTGFHPEGHILKPYTPFDPFWGDNRDKMICVNCAEVDPDEGSECIDDC